MDRSGDLYNALPRDLRPSAKQAFTLLEEGGESEEAGVVAFIDLPIADFADGKVGDGGVGDGAVNDWQRLLGALTARPGRALIDLGEALAPYRSTIDMVASAHEVIFDPARDQGAGARHGDCGGFADALPAHQFAADG